METEPDFCSAKAENSPNLFGASVFTHSEASCTPPQTSCEAPSSPGEGGGLCPPLLSGFCHCSTGRTRPANQTAERASEKICITPNLKTLQQNCHQHFAHLHALLFAFLKYLFVHKKRKQIISSSPVISYPVALTWGLLM